MVIVRIWEGLGNQMFQYAFAKSYAVYTGRKVYLESYKSYNDSLPGAKISRVNREYGLGNFRITLEEVDLSKQARWNFLERRTVWQKIRFIAGEIGLSRSKISIQKVSNIYEYNRSYYFINNCFFMGWFQNERYFKGIRAQLLKDFRPNKKIYITKELKQLLRQKNTVSIHIRRGDFVSLNCALKLQYYERAIAYMNEKIKNPIYIVFTDDIYWSKENLVCNADAYYIKDMGDYEDYEELILMSKCKHNIISSSTFSWWGAWLNRNEEKIVVAPKKWMGCTENSQKLLPSEWIKI